LRQRISFYEVDFIIYQFLRIKLETDTGDMNKNNAEINFDVDAYSKVSASINRLKEPVTCSAIQALQLPQGSRGLDAGGGTGFQALLLAEAVGHAGHVTILDLSAELLDIAKDKMTTADFTVGPVEKAKNGGGPTIIECLTYRWQGHHVGDPAVYRPKDELPEWKKKDPIELFKKRLISEKIFTKKALEDIENEIEIEIAECVKFADESPYPDPSEAFTDIFA